MPHHLTRRFTTAFLAAVLLITDPRSTTAQAPRPVDKEHTPTRILAHYMPWYMAKPFSPVWGWHWTMGKFDPEAAKPGQPAIASHYRPLIGPYDSGDPDVLEYHALLMKLAGIDGVVVDWYGTVDFLDYAPIHRHVSALADVAAKTGLEFAVCYEDQTIPKLVEAGRLAAGERVKHARGELDRIRASWFDRPSYLKINGRPLLLSFGRDGLTDSEWSQVLTSWTQAPLYLSEHARRSVAAGAFDWPVPSEGVKAQDAFYKEAALWPVAMAVAYPRFHDIYEQAKVHKSWGTIDDDGGKTFALTLERALKSNLPFVQICTWNDWGEGTIVEPSVEFGYRDLEVIQRLRRQSIKSAFAGNPQDLRLPQRLFQLRKDKKRAAPSGELDRIAQLLIKGSTTAARNALGAIEH
jgi:Glycosyl hydrolase family 71